MSEFPVRETSHKNGDNIVTKHGAPRGQKSYITWSALHTHRHHWKISNRFQLTSFIQIHVARNWLFETSFFCQGDALILRTIKTHGCAVLCCSVMLCCAVLFDLSWQKLVTSQSVNQSKFHDGTNNTITGLDRPWGFRDFEAPRFQDIQHMKVVRLSALSSGCLYPQEIFLELISMRGRVNSRAISRSEGLCQWKIPMISSGIEPATFWLVVHCFKQLDKQKKYTIYRGHKTIILNFL